MVTVEYILETFPPHKFAYLQLDVAQELKNTLWHTIGTWSSTAAAKVTNFGLCGVAIQSASEPFVHHKALVPADSCVLVMALPFAQSLIFAV